MAQQIDTIYQAKHVVKRYPIGNRTIEILHGLDLDIQTGEFVLLIGPSGCGKSTFMYLMFGLEPPSEGRVIFKGHDVFALSERDRTRLRSQQISMVHQQPIWIKSLTVRENVAFPLTLRRFSKAEALKKAGRLLEVLHLDKLADNHPYELSVGEQQRCSFMRSLITDPAVIFADEPTGSLDTDSSVVVMELFKKINEELGKTIVMVTHNLNHLPYGSKIVSMLDGRIVKTETKRAPVQVSTHKDILDVVSSWHVHGHDTAEQPADSTVPTSQTTKTESVAPPVEKPEVHR